MGQTTKVTEINTVEKLSLYFSAYRDKLERSVTSDQMAFQVCFSLFILDLKLLLFLDFKIKIKCFDNKMFLLIRFFKGSLRGTTSFFFSRRGNEKVWFRALPEV